MQGRQQMHPIAFLATGPACRRHGARRAASELCPQLAGTPETVADRSADLLEDRACDSFIPTPAAFPGMFEQFGRAAAAPRQKRGVFRTEHAARALRGNLRA